MAETARNRYKSNRLCCVPQCSSRTVLGEISLHYFPKDKKQQKLWTTKLKIGKKVHNRMAVCSQHFVSADFMWNNTDIGKHGHAFRCLNPSTNHFCGDNCFSTIC
ncbi:Uncharacterised protein r2_g870 [Pycnogonum litorale]